MTIPDDRAKYFEKLSRFSRRYGIQVTRGRQRHQYINPSAAWSTGASYDYSQMYQEAEYELTVGESALAEIVDVHDQEEYGTRMRRNYPAVKDAWDKYQMLLALYSDYAQ